MDLLEVNKEGVKFTVNVAFDLKSALILGLVLFAALALALGVYAKLR